MTTSKIAKNTAFLLAASIGQKLLSFIYFTIVSGSVGVSGSGKYFLATSFTTLFSILIDLGLSNVLVREVAKDHAKAPTLLGNILGIKILLAAATAIIITLAAGILGYSSELRTMIAIATIVTILDATHLIFYAVMRGMQNLRYEAIGVITGQILTIISGISFVKLGFPLPYLIIALLIGSTWNVIWSTTMLIKNYHIVPRISLNKEIVRNTIFVTLPFALSGIFSRVYSYLDSVMLSKLADELSLGWYGVAYKIAFAFQFLPMAFAAAVYPAMSATMKEDREKLRHVFQSSIEYLFLIAAPLATGIITLAPALLRTFYGEQFLGTVEPLRILMISLIFAFLYWPAGSLLNASDRQAKNTIAMGLTMTVNAIANIILIPRLGAVGAAYAALIGNITLWVTAQYFAHQVITLNQKSLWYKAGKILVSAVLMGLLSQILQPLLPLPVVVIIGALTYASAILLLKAVTISDIHWLIKSVFRKAPSVGENASV